MKKIILMAISIATIGTAIPETSNAQSCVSSSYYQLMSGAPKYAAAKIDTISGSTGKDTVMCQITCNREITFQHSVTKIAGRIDSTTFTIWGSVDGVQYVSLNAQTCTNASGALYYVVNSGVGNPFTYYMVTAACANLAAGSKLSWKGYLHVN